MMTLSAGEMYGFAVQLATPVIAAVSAFFALRTYRLSTRTKAAEFLLALHKSFFVEDTYRKVRDILDEDSAQATSELSLYVSEQLSAFTDFLNFFELVAYMRKESTLSREQVEALLGYYLNRQSARRNVRDYIREPANGFENLDQLLSERET